MSFLRHLRALLFRSRLDRDMTEEMQYHLNRRAAENAADGLSPDEARFAAQRKFGNAPLLRERARDERALAWLDRFAQDLRFAVRALRRSPGFTGIALLTLALGIGVNTAAFSVVNALLLHATPYPHPDELVRVSDVRGAHSPANFADYRAQNTVFAHCAAFSRSSFNLALPGQPADRLSGLLVTPDFFPALGVTPALGRTFTTEEGELGHNAVIVLSHGTWLQRFDGDPSVLGRALRVDGETVTVVGVMPEAFTDYKLWGDIAAWRPLAVSGKVWADRDNTYLLALARLKPGVSRAQAQAGIDLVAARLTAAYPEFNAGAAIRLDSLGGMVQDNLGRNVTWLVMGLAGFVLLIACANLANLQFARNLGRGRDDAIRAALGASRPQLMRRVLLESLVLSLAGGALGCLVAWWANALVGGALVLRDHAGVELPLDGRVLAFTLIVSVATGVGFGLLPAWLASRANVNDALKQGGRSATGGITSRRLRHALIVAEVALALVLLAGAGFFLRGLEQFTRRDAGWRSEGLLTAQLNLRGRSPAENAAFYERLHARLAALPGVESATIALSLPTAGYAHGNTFMVEGRPVPEPTQVPVAATTAVTPGFFGTLGIHLVAGRDFTADDRLERPTVIIINETMARRFWPGENPIGKRIGGATPPMSNPREIIGIVRDAGAPAALTQAPGRPQMYRPLAQRPWNNATVAVRTTAVPEVFARELRRIVAELDLDQAVFQVGTVREEVQRSLAGVDTAARMLGAFALLGALLAAVGIYGVIAGSVAQRTPEIGLRLALGANLRDVLGLVLGQGLRLTLLGVALGLGGAWAVARLLGALIPTLPAAEPLTAAAVALFLLCTALFASWLPARRATKVDPMIALRAE